MKICRFDTNRLGIIQGRSVRDVSAVVNLLAWNDWPQPPGDTLVQRLNTLIPKFQELIRDENTPILSLRDLHLNSPVARPSKIIGTPVNYKKHMDEMNADPEITSNQQVKTLESHGLFLKSPIPVGPDDGVRLRFADRRTDHEVELAIVIGKEAKNIAEDAALNYVAGYSIGLDMTIRGPEDRSLRKSADSHSVLGPWLVTADEIDDPDNLNLGLLNSGKQMQSSNTQEMIFSTAKLIAYASSFYTLYPGDVIMSGTPEGVGPVSRGDILDCTIENIGTMRVPIF